jgi:hypothetical protein
MHGMTTTFVMNTKWADEVMPAGLILQYNVIPSWGSGRLCRHTSLVHDNVKCMPWYIEYAQSRPYSCASPGVASIYHHYARTSFLVGLRGHTSTYDVFSLQPE